MPPSSLDERRSAPAATPGRLFREASLAGVNSFEQLDQRIRIVPTAMRLMAIGAAVILAAGAVWSVFDSIPTRATGRGVLLFNGKGSYAVEPAMAGRITELFVKRGDLVHRGEIIARVNQPTLVVQLQGAEIRLSALQADLAELKRANIVILATNEEMVRQQRAVLDQLIAAGKARSERLSKLLASYEEAKAKGNVSQVDIVDMQQAYDQTMLSVADATAKKIEVETNLEQKREELSERARQAQIAVDGAAATVERLKIEVNVGSSVEAPVDGRINQLRVDVGDVVSPGRAIATIGEVSSVPHFEVVALFGDDMGKRVTKGMDVYVQPVTVRKEEHGTMRGRINNITEDGVSDGELNAILRNTNLTKELIGPGAPLMARIGVVETPDTPSGFAWWVGRGPPWRITTGTLIDVDVVVDRQRPIELLLPALRALLGLQG